MANLKSFKISGTNQKTAGLVNGGKISVPVNTKLDLIQNVKFSSGKPQETEDFFAKCKIVFC